MLHDSSFDYIVSLENLLEAWDKFKAGKRKRDDVSEFELNLEDNIFQLHQELVSGTYRPGGYFQFRVTDPKLRLINKAYVRDRLLHQAIHNVLYPLFDKTFISDSYSCRTNKGTHKAFGQVVRYARKISKNYTCPCWGLKADIKKFFDSISHNILKKRLAERIGDQKLITLLNQIIDSFSFSPGRGMPLGNLTSQLFANVYMDPLDKFVKHRLGAKYYLRYSDDFLLLGASPSELLGYFVEVARFVRQELDLTIHPAKTTLRTLHQGIDFVGYVARPHHNLPRRRTVKRIKRKIEAIQISKQDPEVFNATIQSYLGYLSHVRSNRLTKDLETLITKDIC